MTVLSVSRSRSKLVPAPDQKGFKPVGSDESGYIYTHTDPYTGRYSEVTVSYVGSYEGRDNFRWDKTTSVQFE